MHRAAGPRVRSRHCTHLQHALLRQQLELVLQACRLELRFRVNLVDAGDESHHEAALPRAQQHEPEARLLIAF